MCFQRKPSNTNVISFVLMSFCSYVLRVSGRSTFPWPHHFLRLQHPSSCLRLTQYNVALLLRRRGTCSCTSSRPNATAVNFCPIPRMARFISSKMAVAVNHSPPSMSDTSCPLPTGANSNNLAKHSRRGDAFKTSKLDGVAYPWDGENNRAVWRGMFLGDYTVDLEWREYEK